ncbi:MAG TPA: ATP-binding cassette domain-containing protein, partial [Pyrinomonadaceae bacterium]
MGIFLDVKKQLGNKHQGTFDLSVRFSAGDDITILSGPSGAGKTTTLRLIAGILSPDEGIIEVGGQVYFDSGKRIDLSIQKRRVGYVFQDYALFPHLTAAQNIEYGTKDRSRQGRRSRALEMLSLFR